jgi:cytosine permease
VGIILIISYFSDRKSYREGTMAEPVVCWPAIVGVILGAVVANLVEWGLPSINGMAVAAVCYLVGKKLSK